MPKRRAKAKDEFAVFIVAAAIILVAAITFGLFYLCMPHYSDKPVVINNTNTNTNTQRNSQETSVRVTTNCKDAVKPVVVVTSNPVNPPVPVPTATATVIIKPPVVPTPTPKPTTSNHPKPKPSPEPTHKPSPKPKPKPCKTVPVKRHGW